MYFKYKNPRNHLILVRYSNYLTMTRDSSPREDGIVKYLPPFWNPVGRECTLHKTTDQESLYKLVRPFLRSLSNEPWNEMKSVAIWDWKRNRGSFRHSGKSGVF